MCALVQSLAPRRSTPPLLSTVSVFIVQHPFLVLTAVFSLGTVSFYSYQDVYGDFQSQHLVPRTDVLNSGLANQDTPFLLPW